MNRKTALITGASSGIGFELARVFAANDYDLVLVARNWQALGALGEDLKREHGTTCTILPKDLTLPDAPREIFEELENKRIRVDALVNNAGIGTHGPFIDLDLKQELGMIRLNVDALVALTRYFAATMKHQGGGEVLNVASTAAFMPGPFMAVYYATKAFVLSFSQALSNELAGSGITVTCLCPGATATNFPKRAGLENVQLFKRNLLTAKEVAEAGYRGLKARKRVVIPGVGHKAMVFGARFTPAGLVMQVVRKLQWKGR